MAERLTEELLDELLSTSDLEEYLERNEPGRRTLSEYLNQLLAEKGLERSRVVRMANLNDTFGYQIFQGTRNPSRDKVLQIAFAMALTLRETNRALTAAGVSELYCKDRRDAIIIFCLDRGCSLQKVNEELYRFGEKTIC
ncbi:MAG TPA: XRE family transcriptional regulator [Candidatus Olsenella avicola]|uniref:transcriptional regulator n=1 Tax=Olsenella sp. An285 TaxID=1965621 RepID=UPI000B3A4908|nr:transcriptional regulator [Olsenella sp. An285]OUO48068.1 transcriptional regulator [Olsenella sp. An285]HIY50455.1 XRE family transcriptional regulator [Candidatus Olsenella avicola]